MITIIHIRHKVGWCPVCGAPILDAGWTDDPNGWTHARPWDGESIRPRAMQLNSGPHMIEYGACTFTLSR